MTVVLVHGVPDTERSWDRLRAELARTDVTAVSLPGFGVPTPPGFGATKEEYAAWLEAEILAFGEPVDLVAHDWGALLAQRVASVRPDVIRTLAIGSGPLDRTYTWHAMAQAWQTPEHVDATMAGCILNLYRSAVHVGDEWQDALDAMPVRPALVFHGADDPYLGTEIAERIATRLHAELVVYDGCSHWWAWARAAETAAALMRLWDSV